MAIGTFAELKTATANWLDRSDLTARIPEFITLAEARFNRILRTRDMETVSTAISTAAGTREYSLPTGFVQMKGFHLTTDPLTPLAYITPEMMTRLWAGSSKGKPEVFTIIADNVRLGPNPDAVYTTSMLYYKTFTALSDQATTNDMLTLFAFEDQKQHDSQQCRCDPQTGVGGQWHTPWPLVGIRGRY